MDKLRTLDLDGGIVVPLVTRETWKAVPPTSTDPLEQPITHIRFTYEDLWKYSEDMFEMMPLCQKHYMEKEGLQDVPYNFLIGPGGIIVEGRGWLTKPWRPEEKYPDLKDKSCLDIAYIGDYSGNRKDPDWEMIRSSMYLLMYGLKAQFIDFNFQTVPLRDVAKKWIHPEIERKMVKEEEKKKKKKMIEE